MYISPKTVVKLAPVMAWKSTLVRVGLPGDFLDERLGHAPATFNFYALPVHRHEQVLARRINVTHGFQMDLQWNPGERGSLHPASLQLLDPFPTEFPLQLPSFSEIFLFDRDLQHLSCFRLGNSLRPPL